ncbi:nickel-dependent lactate racemase [Candidatus Bathyarchaeota archaeon]|nr:nickel-dependent lactate racemase [Candidatus Bathyarchaeota archaeon]
MGILNLPYGQGTLSIELPSGNLKTLVEAKSIPGLEDQSFESALSKALDNPVGTLPLSEIASKGKKVAVLIDDHERPGTPTARMLAPIIERLAKAGIRLGDIEVIMATGTHERPTKEQVQAKVGSELLSRLKIHVHYALEKDSLSFLGVSRLGTPIWVNRHVSEADIRIGIGGIVPHPWAGYGGGGKIIMPGVSAWEAVGKHHLLALSKDSRIGKIEGNPFREDAEDIARCVGLDFIVNAVLNDRREVVAFVAGDFIKAQRLGARASREIFENPLASKVDILIMAYGPRDETLWQIIGNAFTLVLAEQVVKSGGTVILMASCHEGIYRLGKGIHHLNYKGDESGHDSLLEMLKEGMRPEEILSETIRGNIAYPELGVKGYLISRLAASRQIVLVSRAFESKEISWLGSIAHGPKEALDEALKTHGRDAQIIVVPRASSSRAFPRVQEKP